MRKLAAYIVVVILCVGSAVAWRVICATAPFMYVANSPAKWNPRSAATYLDSREVWWQKWPAAQMDQGTVCISCHTVVPYALVRPALRRELDEKAMAAPEQVMLASIEKRVTDWANTTPYYTDAADGIGKTAESRSTEAVLNAVILASYDAEKGRLRPITQMAFTEAWALQEKTGEDAGGWKWQNFHLAPWESAESAYQGAALMALALSEVPENYSGETETEARDNMGLLKQYLRRQYDAQPLINKLYVLWASTRTPGLLTATAETKLIDEVADLQLNDGGWVLSSLDEQSRRHALFDNWKRLMRTAQSDGCATGLVVLILEIAGAKQHEATIQRGLEWLKRNQKVEGNWWSASLNGPRDENSDIGRFMSDAATGYAVLALENANRKTAVLNEPQVAHRSN